MPFEPVHRLKECRYGQMLYNIHDLWIGRSLDLYGEYSQGEADLFEQIVRPGSVVIEVGANIGAHTVMLAQKTGMLGRVIALEPQRTVFQLLCANVALNSIPNVTCLQQAVSNEPGTLYVPYLDYSLPSNQGGVQLNDRGNGEAVPVVTLDSLDLQYCQFIKIDVEGMERQVLEGGQRLIERFRPQLYVENDRAELSDALVSYIDSLGYALYWHCPACFNPNNFCKHADNVFSNTHSMNMLCIHKSKPQNVAGFRPVPVPPSN